jgi:anti-sigma factor RsiW
MQLELMSAVLDGEATKDETAALYAHLETCEDC